MFLFIAYIHLALYTKMAPGFSLHELLFLLLKFNFLQISKTTLKLSVSKWVVLDREVASIHQDEIISFCYHHTLLAAGFGDNCLSS